MSKYIMVDGVIQRGNPEAARWAKRAARTVPQGVPEETKEPEGIPRDQRTEYEVLQDLDPDAGSVV